MVHLVLEGVEVVLVVLEAVSVVVFRRWLFSEILSKYQLYYHTYC